MQFNDKEIELLHRLTLHYKKTKALSLFAEEIDPDSGLNLQITKELRDSLDHLVRVFANVFAKDNNKKDENYNSENLEKAIGHIYRASFDALDGTVLSLKLLTRDILKEYPLGVIKAVIPEYWKIKKEVYTITERAAKHREKKDIDENTDQILDAYIEDAEKIKKIYTDLLSSSELLDECLKKTKKEKIVQRIKGSALEIMIAFLSGLALMGVAVF